MAKRYTQEEIEFIKENYKTMTYKEIADFIGTTKAAIRAKVAKIGISKNKGTIGWYELHKLIDDESEIWKDIPEYEGRYKVSNYGRVMSVKRKDRTGCKRNEKILEPYIDAKGYSRVTLSKDMKSERFHVHKLVAICFCENKNNYPIVNHKDENPRNNFYRNLEFCTYQYNLNYGKHNEKVGRTKGREVVQYDLDGNKIAEYYSVGDATKQTGIKYRGILSCCSKSKKRVDGSSKEDYCGYIWKYKNEEKKSIRQVKQYSLSGEFVGLFESAESAARKLNVKSYGIKSCCKGFQKSSHGYVWRYKEDEF